jgi:hypothetical protein
MKIVILGAPVSGQSAWVKQLRRQLQPASAYCVMQVLQPASAPEPDWKEAHVALSDADLILLMGLAAQCQPEHRAADQSLRALLKRLALPYALVYGSGAAACDSALQAVRYQQRDTAGLAQPPSRWRWTCEKCSDPDCEHRLFSDLPKIL